MPNRPSHRATYWSPAPRVAVVAGLAALAAAALPAQDSADTAARREAFEREVRPLLAERCQRCHGPTEQKSGLRLDHGTFVLRGGTRGAAVDRDHPETSRILRAIGYDDPDLQMPPKGRLPAEEVEILSRWIADGAWWPEEPVPSEDSATEAGFDLAARRAEHWCWQPVQRPEIPGEVDVAWSRDPIDRLVRARLDAAGIEPAPAADRATWLRRVTFDLTGLPPTRSELDAFLADDRPDAEERVVDRLLASPHFGERFARHWMDLVRFAETMGHEFDFQIEGAWRYRDALIRAFDQDLPYDRLIVEHLAGDVLPAPRYDPATGQDDSAALTACFWFSDQTHSPVSSRQARADRVDNTIDVVSKSFLGLTVACARCHDHKFDAISTRDYYALAGVVRSSRYLQRSLRDPAVERAAASRVAATRDALAEHLLRSWQVEADAFARLFLASVELPAPPPPLADPAVREREETHWRAAVATLAARHDVDVDALLALDATLRSGALSADHPLATWQRFRDRSDADAESFAAHWTTLLEEHAATSRTDQGDPSVRWLLRADRGGIENVTFDGPAFGTGALTRPVVVLSGEDTLQGSLHPDGWLDSARSDLRLTGTLSTGDFPIDRRYLHLRVAGQTSRINVVLDGFNLIRDPIYGRLKPFVDRAEPHWIRIDLDMWRGHEAFVQFVDAAAPDPADPHRGGGYPGEGWIAVQQVALSDSPRTPTFADSSAPAPSPLLLLGAEPPRNLADLADRYGTALQRAVRDLRGAIPPARLDLELLNACWSAGILRPGDDPAAQPLRDAWSTARRALPEPLVGPTTCEGPGVDERVHLRGSHKNLGDVVPRHFLSALGAEPTAGSGTGRLAYAEQIVAADNPLTARVAVNRLWHHVFGRGLVRTVDNFGVLGIPPTHPEVLDLLAADFVADGWSVKRMLRRLVLTRTYRSASEGVPASDELDPNVDLLHRSLVRRLQGEAIRDAMLAIAGRLDPRRFGPSVPVHLTPFMDGRGRPGRSGPLDGAGRRSVYQETRRNFLNPMFLAFDAPIPFSTVGRRTVSNVPAQALTLLNDPLVHDLARSWAERALREQADPAARITVMYHQAYCRAPRADELDGILAYVRDEAARRNVAMDDPGLWADVAHVLFNVKEFTFLR